MRREISEFGGLQLESCLLSRWRKLEGIKEGPSFSEHGYGLGGSPSYLLGDRKMSRRQSSVVMVTDRALVSEHRAKLGSMVNGREYTSYQCTVLDASGMQPPVSRLFPRPQYCT